MCKTSATFSEWLNNYDSFINHQIENAINKNINENIVEIK